MQTKGFFQFVSNGLMISRGVSFGKEGEEMEIQLIPTVKGRWFFELVNKSNIRSWFNGATWENNESMLCHRAFSKHAILTDCWHDVGTLPATLAQY